MNDEAEVSAQNSSKSTQFDDIDWQSRREVLRRCYQRAPWVHGDAWEFTPRDGVTHPRGCDVCAKFKEHLIVAEAISRLDEPDSSSAWKVRDKYEQELIRLGWDLAHEGRSDPQNDANTIEVLARQNYQLTLRVEILRHENARAVAKHKDLLEELDCERLDASLRGGEVDLWHREYEGAHRRCLQLEERLIANHIDLPSWPEGEDVQMRSMTHNEGTPAQSQPENPEEFEFIAAA